MNFRVVCKRQIQGDFATVSGKDVWLKREITLPFPPYPGLTLQAGPWECEVEEVVWHVGGDSGHFVAYGRPDKTVWQHCRDATLHGFSRELDRRGAVGIMADALRDHLKDGWTCDVVLPDVEANIKRALKEKEQQGGF